MKPSTTNTDPAILETALQEKLEAFRKAEEEGVPREQLHTLYKEVKQLRQQLDMLKPVFKQFA